MTDSANIEARAVTHEAMSGIVAESIRVDRILDPEAFDKMLAESKLYTSLLDRIEELEDGLVSAQSGLIDNEMSIAYLGDAIRANQK